MDLPAAAAAASPASAADVPSLPGHRVHRVLGIGSTATVWSATAPDGTDVALKVVPVHGPLSRERADAVRREVDALRAVDHPRVVRLREVSAVDGAVVLVLDRAVGGSLGALVRARGSLEVPEVAQMLASLAGALADLHAAGVVHGDLSPGNVVFDAGGAAMLTDLGLAAVVGHLGPAGGPDPADRSGAGWPEALAVDGAPYGTVVGAPYGTVQGTPGFADPAATAAGPTPASDVHGLAAVAWYALTGAVPGPASARVPLTVLAPEVGEDLARTLEAAISPVPAHRPDAADLARAAAAAAGGGQPVHLVPSDPGAPPAEMLTHRLRAAAVAAQAENEAPSRHRLVVPAVVVLSCALALGGAWVVSGRLLHGGAATPTASAPTPAASRTATSAAPRTTDEPTGAEPPVRSASPPAPTPVEAAPAPPVPVVDLLADPRAGVATLAAARAEAYTAADASLLGGVDVPGSAAEARDGEVVRSLVDSGTRVRGLSFDVRSAEVVEADPAAGTATVRTTVVTGAHEQVLADGSVQQVPASEPVTSLLVLQRDRGDGDDDAGPWRVAGTG